MHEEAGYATWIPKDKAIVLKTAASIHIDTGLSKIAIINTAADYYKHRSEWKEEALVGPPYKNKTIANAVEIGIGPKGYHNMESALRKLQIYDYDMSPLGRLIDWREALADHIRDEGKKHGVDIRPRYPEDPDIETEAPAPPQSLLGDDDVPFP
jgi:hypothetical protein